MPTLKTNHQPKRAPYKDRDQLLAALLDKNANNQRMADVLEMIAGTLRQEAIKLGHLVDPPLRLDTQNDDPAMNEVAA